MLPLTPRPWNWSGVGVYIGVAATSLTPSFPIPVVALGIELSATRLSAASGLPALDYRVVSVGMVGLEPTIPCPRNTWACRYPTSRFFPVRTAGFEPRAPTGTDADWSLLVPDQARCQASPRSVADRAHLDRSGLGGDRILVSGSSGRRSTVSATSPKRRPDVAVTPGFHVSPAKSVAECHNRQWRRGSVFAGWPATYLAPFCLQLQLDHKVIMYGISFSKRPHRCWGDCPSLQYWTRQHARRFARFSQPSTDKMLEAAVLFPPHRHFDQVNPICWRDIACCCLLSTIKGSAVTRCRRWQCSCAHVKSPSHSVVPESRRAHAIPRVIRARRHRSC